jgi:hypothetical protein
MIDGRYKPKMKILIEIEIFAERPNMSRQITGQVWQTLLESDEEAEHIRCPKSDSPVCKIGHSDFDKTEN